MQTLPCVELQQKLRCCSAGWAATTTNLSFHPGRCALPTKENLVCNSTKQPTQRLGRIATTNVSASPDTSPSTRHPPLLPLHTISVHISSLMLVLLMRQERDNVVTGGTGVMQAVTAGKMQEFPCFLGGEMENRANFIASDWQRTVCR
jgi:hypothetical protein